METLDFFGDNSAVNVEFKGGFYYGIQDIWCLFQRHFI